MSLDPRIEAASKFLLQSPPGEINDVLNDVRTIVSDDASLQTGILPALESYNVAQFITVDVPGQSHQVIVSEAGRVEGSRHRFIDPRSHTSFELDHIRLETSDPQAVDPDPESEPFRAALETATLAYVADHFTDGVATVFKPSSSPQYVIQIVANKYNSTNFWSGRWRSEYTVDVGKGEVVGRVLINVHYYENGNVQLSATHKPTFSFPPYPTLPPTTSASKILASIELQEGEYQTSLNDTYAEMGEKTFKGLRRALPLTRQKMDWDKVMGYRLGAELNASRGATISSSS
ncbi:hypothetical protein BS47DRAFT_1312255 [Hydnum rufescens UP504]|uniref:F-actin-capping protein subunit alpha n=1 Tax=Hydnum rufescens UP504 TaxID=1448309 RepID=A0A9P6B8Y7_9AGAM|nr:hypothetical protein BS47DRAFT_1312255 [Hydnum rufescens UP504]